MVPIEFPEQNIVFAKDQDEYQTMPAFKSTCELGEVTSCLQLTDEEIKEVVRTGKIYYTQLTFNDGYNPGRTEAFSPFKPQSKTDG